jgi:hypothetical protein
MNFSVMFQMAATKFVPIYRVPRLKLTVDQTKHLQVKFQVLTAASMKATGLWDVAPCTVIPRYSRVLRFHEMPRIWKPRIARFGAHSKTGITFRSVKFKRKTSQNVCLFVCYMYSEIYVYIYGF